jgi:YD repeat-containing protein
LVGSAVLVERTAQYNRFGAKSILPASPPIVTTESQWETVVMARRLEYLVVGIAIGSVPALAIATETINYSYDAKGRLIQVVRTGTINNGVTTNYTYDRADNRTNKTTTGSPNPGPP